MKRTVLIDDVANGDDGGKQNQTVKLQLERQKPPQHLPFPAGLVPHQDDPKLRLRHGLLPHVGHAKHQGGPSVEGRENQRLAEDDFGDRPGKADENQAGHDRHSKHPDNDLERSNHMAKQCGRIHMPITHRGERFDAEEKRIRPGIRFHSRDAIRAQMITKREQEIDAQVQSEHAGRERRPSQGQ